MFISLNTNEAVQFYMFIENVRFYNYSHFDFKIFLLFKFSLLIREHAIKQIILYWTYKLFVSFSFLFLCTF